MTMLYDEILKSEENDLVNKVPELIEEQLECLKIDYITQRLFDMKRGGVYDYAFDCFWDSLKGLHQTDVMNQIVEFYDEDWLKDRIKGIPDADEFQKHHEFLHGS